MVRGITNSTGDSSRASETSIMVLLATLRGFPAKYYLEAQDGRKAAQEQRIRLLVIGLAQRLTVMILTTSTGYERVSTMQNAQVFKKRYLLLILLAVVAYGIYNLLHFSPLEQVIIKKVKVNNLANLYITEASAGATTGFSYRFYLYDVTKDDKAFMASLENDHQPFMITTDKDALKKVENNAIYLSVKGTIYTFHSPADYLAGGSIYSVPVYLTASPY